MIGLFDSGLGGLFSLRAVRRLLPRADLLYFADTAHLPYGKRTREELFSLTEDAIALLASRGAQAVMAACGTVSSAVLPFLLPKKELPLFGILEPLSEALPPDTEGEVLLLATEATVEAGVMGASLARRAPRATVRALPCPRFVELAESELLRRDPQKAEKEITCVLRDALSPAVSAVVLGCTHFSALALPIARLFPRARILDGAALAAFSLVRTLAARAPRAAMGEGRLTLLASGDCDRFSEAAAHILGRAVTAEATV